MRALSTCPRKSTVEPGLTCRKRLMVSRYSRVLLRFAIERGGVRLEEEADVLAQQRIVLERGLLRRADGRDGDALIRVQPLLRSASSALVSTKRCGSAGFG